MRVNWSKQQILPVAWACCYIELIRQKVVPFYVRCNFSISDWLSTLRKFFFRRDLITYCNEILRLLWLPFMWLMLNNGNYFESLREKGSTKTAFVDRRHKVQKEKKMWDWSAHITTRIKWRVREKKRGKDQRRQTPIVTSWQKRLPILSTLKREYKLTCITFFH